MKDIKEYLLESILDVDGGLDDEPTIYKGMVKNPDLFELIWQVQLADGVHVTDVMDTKKINQDYQKLVRETGEAKIKVYIWNKGYQPAKDSSAICKLFKIMANSVTSTDKDEWSNAIKDCCKKYDIKYKKIIALQPSSYGKYHQDFMIDLDDGSKIDNIYWKLNMPKN